MTDSKKERLKSVREALKSAIYVIGQFRLKQLPPTQMTWEEIHEAVRTLNEILGEDGG